MERVRDFFQTNSDSLLKINVDKVYVRYMFDLIEIWITIHDDQYQDFLFQDYKNIVKELSKYGVEASITPVQNWRSQKWGWEELQILQ